METDRSEAVAVIQAKMEGPESGIIWKLLGHLPGKTLGKGFLLLATFLNS